MKENLKIRKANVADIPAIENIYAKRVAYNDAYDIHQWSIEEVNWQAFSRLYTIDDYYVGIYEGSIVCGLFIVDVDEIYWPNVKKGESLYLHKICVDPDFSGCGFADELIHFFKEMGRVNGYSHVRLDVRAHKDKLRAMYERNGFVLHSIHTIVAGYETALYTYTSA